jgi:hypothetical protein
MFFVNEHEDLFTGSTKTITFNLKIRKNFTPTLVDPYGNFRRNLLHCKEVVRKCGDSVVIILKCSGIFFCKKSGTNLDAQR